MSTGTFNAHDIDTKAIKNSKAFYAAVIFGFLAIFWLIILPFLPMKGSSSFFESGFNYFNNMVEGNLFSTISMIPHTLFLLIAGIVILNKFKTHKAAAVYSFYRLYTVTMYLAFLIWLGFTVTGFEDFLYMSYCVEYWYYVLGTYLVGLIFVLIGQLATPVVHAGKYKSRYNFLSWVVLIGLYFWSLSAKNNVYVRQIFNSSRGALEQIYTYIGYALFLCLLTKTFIVVMPINNCYSFMYDKELKRDFDSLIPVKRNVFWLTLASAFALYVMVVGAYYELIFASVLMLYFIIQIIAAKRYNNTHASVNTSTGSAFSSYGYNNVTTGTGNGSTQTTSNASSNPTLPTPPVSKSVSPEDEIVWNVGRLKSYNETMIAKEKVPLNVICNELFNVLQDNGLQIEMTELREVLSAFASSNLIFIRCGEEALVKRFAKVIAEYFNSELFFEKRTEKDAPVAAPEILPTPAPEVIPVPEVIPTPEAIPTEEVPFNAENIIPTTEEGVTSDATEEDVVSENTNTKNTDIVLPATEDAQADQQIDSEPVPPEMPAAQTEVKPIKKELTEEEIRELRKYGLISGIYVSYHLSDVISPIFVDNISVKEVDDLDAEIMSAVSNRDQTVFVGKKKYLAPAENYDRGSLVVPENLRMVVFVGHDDTEISAHHEWVKYSTVLSLNINESFVQSEEYRDTKLVSHSVLCQAVEEAQDDNYLTEDYWKKIDRLEEYLTEKANISFDNLFLRQVERYAATFLSCGASKAETLDAVLANRIIPYIATEKESVLGAIESDFSLHLDELFGYENIPITKNAIAEYGLKK